MSDAPAPPPVPPPRRRLRWLRPGLFAIELALAAPIAGLAWLLLTESGLQFAAGAAEKLSGGRLTLAAPRGALLGEMRFDVLTWRDADLEVALRRAALDWSPAALLARRLDIGSLTAAELRIRAGAGTQAARLPEDLRLPLALRIGRVSLERIEFATGAGAGLVLGPLAARVESDGRSHRLEELRLATPLGRVEGGASLAGAPPFAFAADAALAGRREGRDYRLRARAEGPLAAFALRFEASGFELGGAGRADIAPFETVPLRRLEATLGELDLAALRPGAPRTALSLHADLKPEAGAGEWALAGPLVLVNRVAGRLDAGRLPLAGARGELRWAGGRVAVEPLRLEFSGGGTAAGSARWQDGRLSARIDLRRFDLQAVHAGLRPTRIDGRIGAEGDAHAQRIEVELREPRFTARAALAIDDQGLRLEQARLARGGAQLDGAGRLAWGGAQAFELRGRLARFDPALLLAALPPARLDARFDARGTLAPAPAGEIEVVLDDSVFDGKPLSGRGRVAGSLQRIARAELALDWAGNRVDVNGAFGAAGDRLAWRIEAPKLSALGHGLAGTVAGEGLLTGSFAAPAGEWRLAASGLRLPGALSFASAESAGRIGVAADAPLQANVVARGLGRAGEVLAGELDIALAGVRGAHTLSGKARLGAGGTLAFAAAGGLLEGPRWQGSLGEFALRGNERFDFALAAPARLEADAQAVALGPAEFVGAVTRARLDDTRITRDGLIARGSVSGLPVGLVREEGEPIRAGGDSMRLGAQWDVRIGERRVDGLVRVVRESGDLALAGDTPVSLGLTELTLTMSAADNQLAGALDARGRRLGTVAGSFTGHAEHGPEGWRLARGAPVAGSVVAHMPSLAWVGPALDPNLQTEGRVDAEFSVTGTGDAPDGAGSVRAEGLAVALLDQGLRLSGGRLAAEFDARRVRLTALEFASANRARPRESRLDLDALTREPGRLSANGEIELASGRGWLDLRASHLPILQRPDRWLMVSGSGRVAGTAAGASLTGKLAADAGYVEYTKGEAPALSDDVMVKGRRQGRRVPLAIDLEADLGREFYFRGRGLDTRLTGQLRLRADGRGMVRASGSIRTADGKFDAYGQSLAIERGVVNFQGPLDNPGLNVLALRKGLPVEAGVLVTGTVAAPRVKLYSEPDVPDPEKLSWIVLGRGQDQARGADSALLMSAASAILGGQSEGVSSQLMRALGLDQLSVTQGDPLAGESRLAARSVAGSLGSAGVSREIVSLGKRLSGDAFLSYEQSLAGAESVVKLTYRLTRSLSLIGRAGADNALDLFWSFSFK